MTYNKETRAEEMEIELREDKIRETCNEIDDGAMDTWIGENKEDLLANFIDENSEEWKEYCKDSWKEHNEELI